MDGVDRKTNEVQLCYPQFTNENLMKVGEQFVLGSVWSGFRVCTIEKIWRIKSFIIIREPKPYKIKFKEGF